MGYQEAPLDEFARNSPFLLLRVFLSLSKLVSVTKDSDLKYSFLNRVANC